MKIQFKHPRIIGVLFSIILTLIFPEILLQIFDPWGVKAYVLDLRTMFARTQFTAERGYVLEPGEYQFLHWVAHVDSQHNRVVPDTSQTGCTLVMVGDSVTFGHGVNDDETWTNRLARQFTDIHFIDAGVDGYNAERVRLAIAAVKGDGYLYLMIGDDAAVPYTPTTTNQGNFLLLVPTYWYYATQVYYRDRDDDLFDRAVASMKANPQVITVGIEGDVIAARAKVPTIPPWKHKVSRVDPHPNASGTQEVAQNLAPFIQSLQQKVCAPSTS